jgi:hypothetical protein
MDESSQLLKQQIGKRVEKWPPPLAKAGKPNKAIHSKLITSPGRDGSSPAEFRHVSEDHIAIGTEKDDTWLRVWR